MPSASVIPLLSSWEEYVALEPQGDIQGFARWIISKEKPAKERETKEQTHDFTPPADLDDTARGTLLIARLHRILRVLSKPVIKELGFTKDMEFTVLVHVAILDNPNKKELG